MKRLTSFFLCLILICVFTPFEAYAKLSKEDIRHINQEAKNLEKEGWKVFGGGSIRDGLQTISELEVNDNNLIIVGRSYSKLTIDLAFQFASSYAMLELSRDIGLSKVSEDFGTQMVNVAFRLEMHVLPFPIMTLYRENNKGLYDCIIYYYITKKSLSSSQFLDEKLQLIFIIEGSFEESTKI